jgi:hypothetical protein
MESVLCEERVSVGIRGKVLNNVLIGLVFLCRVSIIEFISNTNPTSSRSLS